MNFCFSNVSYRLCSRSLYRSSVNLCQQKRLLCLTHIDKSNKPTMVNVSNKDITLRIAHARCFVELPQNVVDSLTSITTITTSSQPQEKQQPNENQYKSELISKKGPVLTTSIIAGVMAAKKTSDLIPFCHPISIDDCQVKIEFDEERKNTLRIDCIVQTRSSTGVEMEAFVGASNTALCIYDMCKAVSHDIKITDLQLISKTGGKRNFHRFGSESERSNESSPQSS